MIRVVNFLCFAVSAFACLALYHVSEQTRVCLDRIKRVLGEAGASLTDIASATVWLTDLKDFQAFNAAWAEGFGDHRPTRATVRADLALPGLVVEIAAIAVLHS